MPTISMFYGILISMNYAEHNPPHFHAKYGEYNASFLINGDLLKGEFPDKQRKIVSAWAVINEDNLMANWELAKIKGDLQRINPI